MISMPEESFSLSQKRDTCFKEQSRIRLATKYFHTHAHLDLMVWHSPPQIPALTRQYMCGKYAISLKYLQLHISFHRSRMSLRHQSYMPQRGSTNTTYNERSECTTEGEGKLCFLFKIYTNTPSDRIEGWKGLCFTLFHFSTAQSFMVDSLNPAVQVWLEMV
jgi:hypothetical protein